MDADVKTESSDKRLNNLIAVTVVILSVLMAVSNIKGGNIGQAMQKAKTESVDAWAEYQAARLKLIPGARAAWQAALHAGAAAVAISGSGPSLIAFVSLATDATRVAREMAEAFAGEGVPAIPLGLRASAAGATVAS